MHLPKTKLIKKAPLKSALETDHDAISVFKKALQNAHRQLGEHQHQGISAAELIDKYTWAIDQMVVLAWEKFYQPLNDCKVALIAVGGYGRGELHPYSDIDLLILLEKNRYQQLQPIIAPFLQFLWDIGLQPGHSARSHKDCIKQARADITVMTNLLEARFLAGDTELLPILDGKIRHGRLWSPERFFAAKFQEQHERHAAFQDTAYSLEPNLKESPGGLRDLQTILWVYNRSFGVRSFKQMKDAKHINNDEYRLLIRARNMLWKLRCGLHLDNHRREDRLLFDHQRKLARDYGYQDTGNHLAVEQLMKRYYRTVKLIRYLNEVLLSNFRVNHTQRFSLAVNRPISSDFQIRNKMIAARNTDIFDRQPSTMLEMFGLMQNHRVTAIHPDSIRAVRANVPKITPQFRRDPHCKALFLALFQSPTPSLATLLSRMNDYGVLGSYLPSFGAIVGQMQHDLFHVYTVDGHTLQVINNLVSLGDQQHQYPLASALFKSLYRPERVLLAALFHDIAKGRGGDHSELGEVDAIKFCQQHGLSDYDAKMVGWLVRNHLIMSHYSQRRDTSDPTVIAEFAELVGDHEYLDNLYLLTHADIRGTSPKVWNAWKGQLLKELYQSASGALNRGLGKPINEHEHVAQDKTAALEKLRNSLGAEFTPQVAQRVEEFWSHLRNDYFIRNDPYYIAWHANALCQASAVDLPLVSVRYSERLQANMVFVFAPKTSDLLARVTYAFDSLEIGIVEAQLQTSTNGFALYSFNATTEDQAGITDERTQRNLESRLRQRILHLPADRLISRRSASRTLKHFPIRAQVNFSQTHNKYTVMEVTAQDQPGLLHNVAMILQRHNVKPISAKIATFGERAEDIFFIQTPDGKPVTQKNLLGKLQRDLTQALDRNMAKAIAV